MSGWRDELLARARKFRSGDDVVLRPLSPRTTSLIVAALVFLSVVLALLPATDEAGRAHVDEAFRRALVGFALARGLNGVISVAQGTEVAVQPAGVGVNFAPGEVLDPINDLVERFSWIMLLASSSLGVQKVLLSMSAWQGLLVALVAAGALFVGARFLGASPRLRVALQRVFLFLLLLRFMMPAIALANDWVYRAFLEEDYVEASASLERAREAIGEINEEVAAERRAESPPEGLLDRAQRLYRDALASVDIDARLDQYRAAAETISESTIRLIVVFLMQTLVFPLVFLYVVIGLLRRIVRR